METPKLTVSEFVDVCNQSLESAYGSIIIEGEVASFKVNQSKWVFFDLKDDESSISCFMTLWQLRIPIEDGMKVVVRGTPKITKWGKFSFTVQQIQPVGEGNIKKSFELLKRKLSAEGLFDPARKRPIPADLHNLGIISSTGAAGYADFVKILNARWGGLHVQVAHTQVQGLDAPDQIIRALKYFNEHAEVQAIAILRGGGSADDLAVFNDEQLVRAVAVSRIPIITGIGHEVDESLADLAADLRASTPSNAAELIVPDRRAAIAELRRSISNVAAAINNHISSALGTSYDIDRIKQSILSQITQNLTHVQDAMRKLQQQTTSVIAASSAKITQSIRILESFNPDKVLRRGYAILTGKISPGNVVKITTYTKTIKAEIQNVKDRN